MLKNILITNGAQELSKNELKSITGSGSSPLFCLTTGCPEGYLCCDGVQNGATSFLESAGCYQGISCP